MAPIMGVVQLDSPATAERSRVAVGAWIVQWAKAEPQEAPSRVLFASFCMIDFFLYVCIYVYIFSFLCCALRL